MRFTETPPRSIMEVFKMLPEGTLAEVIHGAIYMSPAPTPKHQRIVGKLFRVLTDYVEKQQLGEIVLSPCDVFLDETMNAVQPDILFIASHNSSLIGDDAIHGVPDMIIEVLSPGNRQHDLVRKKELYQKFQVKEYWIINPETLESLGFTLRQGKYADAGQFTGKIKSILLHLEFAFQ
jgi:Uma2 family endonuclease